MRTIQSVLDELREEQHVPMANLVAEFYEGGKLGHFVDDAGRVPLRAQGVEILQQE